MRLISTVGAWPAWVSSFLAAIMFSILVSLKGVPALRHDWSWDADAGSFFSNFWSSFGGWHSFGIGLARPYPDDYLLALANVVPISLLGSAVVYPVEMAAIGFACSFGASRLAECLGPTRGFAIAAATFALFNPWVYNKVVAGHIFMVLAYGATMLAISEMLQPEPSVRRLTIFMLLTLQQLQFFFPLFAAVAVWSLRRRGPFLPLAVAFIAALPVLVGIVADRRYLVSIPYTATWQTNASIAPRDALILFGYFAKYGEALPGFIHIAGWIVVAIAAVGTAVALVRYPRQTAPALFAFACIWILSSGNKGLLGPGYTWLVLHVPESGLYRELYDLVGFLAIGLIAACAYASRAPFLRALWAVCGLAFVLGWCIAPPSNFWVSYNAVPRASVIAPANSRFALFPALQPLALGRTGSDGSGLDTDAVVRSNNVDPLNTPQLSFPESPALMAYERSGDERWFSGLSVSEFIVRPYLHTRYDILGAQLAIPVTARTRLLPGSHTLTNYEPELALHAVPELDSTPGRPWETTIFFGDVRDIGGTDVPASWSSAAPVSVVHSTSGAVSATEGWVDVRSAFASQPFLAQGIGGVITTNSTALLSVDPLKWTLVLVRGVLLNEHGSVVARTRADYQWILPGNATFRCAGMCVVSAQTVRPSGTTRPVEQAPAALTFAQWSSWLAFATLPPGQRALLRYNVRYDEHWIAILAGTRLTHVPIDSTFNGWLVPARDRSQRLVLIEWIAALQFALMCSGSLVVTMLCAYWLAFQRKAVPSEATVA